MEPLVSTLKRTARLCQVAYDPDPVGVYSRLGYHAVPVEAAGLTDQAYLLRCKQHSELVVVVRGTDDPSDWILRNMRFLPQLDQETEQWGMIARGFWAASESLIKPLRLALSVVDRPNGILFAGHSLGGIAADILVRRLWPEVGRYSTELITFGAPRGGDRRFAESLPCAHARVVNPLDPVPRFYPSRFGFAHSGVPVVWDGGDIYQVGREAWERAKCEGGSYLDILGDLPGRIAAHFSYFGGGE